MRCPGFAPASLLDAGSGPGTASWAAVETWSDIAMVTMIDTNPTFFGIARRLTAESGNDALARTESRQRDILAIADELAADLVVASFALTELGLHEQAATRLWRVTGAVLVVIEPGTPAGFACMAPLGRR
jgi:ribosomal protein RSM22 (predicted rRNA methylase)